ncbi:MAG TPA: adenylate/guanylate cyclase domain-containing protein [Streptosporangiaceae bacterium]
MICTACHSGVPDGARFCPSCGTAVAAAVPRRELRKTVTVLFCDITESTELSGRLDAESLREVMVRYYSLMRGCLERHGGTVEKFIGDAVVAVFGVPVLHEDDALRALNAAMEMLDAVESLNGELSTLIGVRIGVRIGVNTGEVVAADDVSSGQALAAGEAVNVAARLQAAAAPGEILVGPVTRALAGSGAALASVGELTLKGVTEPVPAWRLMALEPPEGGSLPGFGELFVGRSAELGQLTRVLDEAIGSASCRLVTVHGEPGAGKTRLAAEFAARAAGRGALVGAGRCHPYGEGSTLHALGEALRQVVDAATSLLGVPPPDVRDALASLESGLFRDGAPGELPDQLIWAATLLLETAGRIRPVLLILDDLHSAKPELLLVVNRLASRITGAAVLVLGLGRPELIEAGPAWAGPGASLLALGPLSTQESALLVAALSEVSQTSEVTSHRAGLAERIVERAGGNPFFLEQLVAITGHAGGDSLPPTVQSVIAARLDLLGAAEQDVLLRAAVPGARFSAPELGALLEAEPPFTDPPDQALGTLARRRLIVPERSADAFRFSGVLIRDVAYHTLSKRARLLYHEVLARWHQHQMSGPDLVGMHLERAYRLAAELHPADRRVQLLRADAARTLAMAGALALRRSDLHWAADLLANALELHDGAAPERIAIGLDLAEARLLLGTDPDARQTLRNLAGQAAAAGDQRTAAHARLMLAALELPGPSAAEEALATVPVFEQADDHLGLARAWLRVGQLRQLSGRYGEAEDLLRRALRHALATNTQFELATVIGGLATSLWRGPAPAGRALADCRTLLAEHGNGRRAVRATVNCPRAVLFAYRGEYHKARSLVRTSTRIIAELGHSYGAATMQIFAAIVEGAAGRWQDAEVLLRSAAQGAESHGDTLSNAAASAGLARALLEQDREDAALDAAGLLVATGDPFLDADIMGVRARALAALGEREPALREATRARVTAAVTDSTVCQATAELDCAHVLRALDDDEGAAAAAAAARRLFEGKGHVVGVRRVAVFLETPLLPAIERGPMNEDHNVLAAAVAHLGEAERDHSALLAAVVNVARELFGAAAASVFLLDTGSGELVFEAVSGVGEDHLLGDRFPAARGIAGWVLTAQEPVVISDLAENPVFARDIAEVTGYVPSSLMAAPLLCEEDAIGVMEVLDPAPSTVSPLETAQLLALFAGLAAVALNVLRRNRIAYLMLTGDGAERSELVQVARLLDQLGADQRAAGVNLLDSVHRLLSMAR